MTLPPERHLFRPDPDAPHQCFIDGRPAGEHVTEVPVRDKSRRKPAVHRDPTDTEVAAAGAVAPALNRLQQRVLEALRAVPDGLTVEELVEAWEWPPAKRTTVGPRCSELQRLNLIVDSGLRRQGPHQGSPSIVWQVSPVPVLDRW